MRLSLRFVIPLVAVLSLIAYWTIPLVDELTLRWFSRDLDMRAQLLSGTVQESLVSNLRENSPTKTLKIFNRMIQDERLYALGFCDNKKHLVVKTQTFPQILDCLSLPDAGKRLQKTVNLPSGLLHVSFEPVAITEKESGHLIVIHDMSFVQRRSADTKWYVFYFLGGLALIVSAMTVVIAQLSWMGWVRGIRSLIRGEGLLSPTQATPELTPIAKDLRSFIRDLAADRKMRDESQMTWSPRMLKEILQKELSGEEILIVSNREPYIHTRSEGKVEIQLPASGLVTALEPVMRACSGTWIAHGSGNADREFVDQDDHVKVPPHDPTYQIRRVWLSKEEEKGYYYGFSNEGLWPLCHIAHTRPVFRAEDWKQYLAVNEKFAKVLLEEANTEDPVILVQDYHFALLPRLIRQALPNATVITFWHIPWPNPEAFGICPWRDQILEGLLGSSILGFHTRFHSNNFVETVDRFLECRIDRETSTISQGGELTCVNQYPISIEWPPRWVSSDESWPKIYELNGFPSDRVLGIGVDRLDYTKGILERFMAVERLLELYPEWIGKFTFVQIAAPTRSSIDQYQFLETSVRSLARKVNARFGTEGYEPICLKVEHHEPQQVYAYLKAARLCFVSSLHDGMNLVAKEFVAARNDELGVLILSQFTGASRELPQALIVNPYDIDQCAMALKTALEMEKNEQRERMRSMRSLVQEFNVYRWAGRMLIDAARLRQQKRFTGRFGALPLVGTKR